MNAEQPIPFPENLDEDWRVSELTEALSEPSPEIPNAIRITAEAVAPLLLPRRFPRRPRNCLEPEATASQQLLYAVTAERPAMNGDDLVEINGSDTYYLMDALSYPTKDAHMCMIAHWGRRVGFMLEGVPFRRSGKLHWEFDEDIFSGERYEQLIEWALADYESDAVRREQLREIVAFIAGSEHYQGIARDMIGLSLAQIRLWRDLQAARLTKYIVRRAEHEATDRFKEPSPKIIYDAKPADRFAASQLTPLLDEIVDPVDGTILPAKKRVRRAEKRANRLRNLAAQPSQLPLDEIMDENGVLRPSQASENLSSEYEALLRIASMTRKMADKDFSLLHSYKDYCGNIARHLAGKDVLEHRRVIHNARFAAFVILGVHYEKYNWEIWRHAGENRVYQDHELPEIADDAVRHAYENKELGERLEVFLKLVATTENERLLARRIACLTFSQIGHWRLHRRREQDYLQE
ncbi:MAG: hypothetical protein WBP12_01390 [Candidatus Saccharimonas sp.]